MSKPVGRIIGEWAGISASIVIAGAGIVALRHALETPQPLKSVLPGEAHLYRWQRRSIFYKVSGPADAPALVLLHSPDFGASGHEMAQIMEPLSLTRRVYTLDLLGFGLSDRPDVEYSADLYSTLCQDFLRDVVQRPATLVASGLSCNYAVEVAARVPELCASLVLISPHALLENQQSSPLGQYIEKAPVKTLLYPLLSTHLAFLLLHKNRREGREDFPQFYANTHQLGAEHAAIARLAGKLSGKSERQFEMLQQPVLMIWGTLALDDQHIVSSLHQTAVLANPSRQTRKVELIQGAALNAHNEQPEAVIAAIQRWQKEMDGDDYSVQAETPMITLPAKEATPRPLVAQDSAEPQLASEPTQSRIASKTVQASARIAPSMPPSADQSEMEAEKNVIPASELNEKAESIPASTLSPAARAGERAETATGEKNGAPAAEIVAYCVKCKQKRIMVDARQITMKNGRPALRGVCSICKTQIIRIGSKG